MQALRPHFAALLTKINPTSDREKVVGALAQEIRDWLEEHDYETAYPHTRLIGSYARHTAVLWIKDVDVLVFLPEAALDRTPNAVLLELRRVLEDFPGADVEAIGQHRSIRMEMEDRGVIVDIVPAVAPDGLDKSLRVPDRPKQKWIDSDPLGYMTTLSTANQEHTKCLVPFIKLIKAWRDVQMKVRRPKSYMLEVMVFDAVTDGHVVLTGRSWPERLADLFAHWKDRWEDLMDNGEGVPRICDPQLGRVISAGWERAEFETFMRRVRDADRAARTAETAESEEEAAAEWAKLFGGHWPTAEEIEEKAVAEAAEFRPGQSRIASAGWVTGPSAVRTVSSLSTRFHGE